MYALGNGNGTFGTQGGFTGEYNVSGFLARDFNLHSRPDVVIPSWMSNGFDYGLNTSAYTNCAPPNSSKLAAKICMPGAGAIVSNPITVRGSGNSPLG